MTLTNSSEPLLTLSGHRAEIRLNRPAVMNRLQPEDLRALENHLARIEADDAIRVLVLTGTGRVFSSGYDLGDLKERHDRAGKENLPDIAGLTVRLENLRVPTICRLNGPVYGAATDLALCCDFRIGTSTCEMVMPAARLGIHYYPEGLDRWTRRLGPNAARRLFLTATTLHAQEMLHIGYLDFVVDAQALDAQVDALANQLAANAPRAVEGMKLALNQAARGELDWEGARARHVESTHSEDAKEGLQAWREKRAPVFRRR